MLIRRLRDYDRWFGHKERRSNKKDKSKIERENAAFPSGIRLMNLLRDDV